MKDFFQSPSGGDRGAHLRERLDLPRLLGDLRMQAGRLDGPTHLPTHGRHEGDFVRAMAMSLLVLQVDDADHLVLSDDGHGQEGLMTVLGQVMKPFEPRIIAGITGNRYGPDRKSVV